ncbi:MAG: hypothetical protein ACPIOQ_35465, partial [Promethearchaeia archaeon]
QRALWVQQLREAAEAPDSQHQPASIIGDEGLAGAPLEAATSMQEVPMVRSSSSPSPTRSDTPEPVRLSTRTHVGETCEGCRARTADVKRYRHSADHWCHVMREGAGKGMLQR